MANRPPIFRPSDADHEQAERMRDIAENAREVLKQPKVDTFLGRKTREPFPVFDASDESKVDPYEEALKAGKLRSDHDRRPED